MKRQQLQVNSITDDRIVCVRLYTTIEGVDVRQRDYTWRVACSCEMRLTMRRRYRTHRRSCEIANKSCGTLASGSHADRRWWRREVVRVLAPHEKILRVDYSPCVCIDEKMCRVECTRANYYSK